MRLTRQRRQLLVTGAFLLVAILGGAGASSLGILDQNLQASVYDFLIQNAGDAPRSQVTIVAIDDSTISRYGGWPLRKSAYADVVRALGGGTVRVCSGKWCVTRRAGSCQTPQPASAARRQKSTSS